MLNLPLQTQVNKQLPKTAIFQSLQFDNKQKESFDKDISRVYITNEISEKTMNIKAGEDIKSFFVLHIVLKTDKFDEKNIIKLSKFIPQNIVFVLEYEGSYSTAIFHTRFLKSKWTNKPEIKIQGLNLDIVWENIVKSIGDINIENENTIEEQILIDEKRDKILNQIEKLEKQARAEKQPKKKFKLVQEIKRLRFEIEGGI